MSNELTPQLKNQIFAQEATDPFLTLVTLTTPSFTYRLVNNSSDVASRGNTFSAMPFKIQLPVDDGQTARDVTLTLDNVSLELIVGLRAYTGVINCTVEMILASLPDIVQMQVDDLILASINYNAKTISAVLALDNFLIVGMTSEQYTPNNFPGLF